MDKKLLEILACPVCKGSLIYEREKNELICRADKLVFEIKDGIPVMLANLAKEYVVKEDE